MVIFAIAQTNTTQMSTEQQRPEIIIQQREGHRGAKLLMLHGDRDELLLHSWGRITFEQLQRFGVRGGFRTIT